MTILTKEQEELFYVWIKKYIKDYGHNFPSGWYILPVGTDEYLSLDDPNMMNGLKQRKKNF